LLWALTDSIIVSMPIWNSLHKAVCAGAIVALSTGMASAQLPVPGITLSPDGGRTLTPEEKEKQNAIDEKYRASLKQIPEKRTPSDPWSNMRSTPAGTAKQRQQ
jgi:hypothetical protein